VKAEHGSPHLFELGGSLFSLSEGNDPSPNNSSVSEFH
jgi:hypothetical protein